MHDNNDSPASNDVDNDSNCLLDSSDSNESSSFLNGTSTHGDSKDFFNGLNGCKFYYNSSQDKIVLKMLGDIKFLFMNSMSSSSCGLMYSWQDGNWR